MKKKIFYSEISYLLGLLILPLGGAFFSVADFGLSMVVAPCYLLHVKVSEYLPFFSFGMATYTFQLLLLVVLAIVVKKFRMYFLGSFVTAFLFGLLLDLYLYLLSFVAFDTMAIRIISLILGVVLTAIGVSFFFHTYLPPQAYELFVKEIALKFKFPIGNVKLIYDLSSLTISVLLSFLFFGFGSLVGIGIGTLLCAALNGFLIGKLIELYNRFFETKDLLPLKKYFS